MLRSMTGFASAKGALPPHSWGWELRSVNAKGLDLRLRVPDWIEGLETALRSRMAKSVQRGSVTLSLRVTREETGGDQTLNTGQLSAILDALTQVEAEAMERGVSLAPSKATDILALRGVLEQSATTDAIAPLLKQLLAEAEALITDFNAMRASEGAALLQVLGAQLDDIARLTDSAADLAVARKDDMAAALRSNLARVLDNSDGADAARVAQELAMIAVKTDVTEEIDRLRAHVDAARDLLAQRGSIGRKLDFLMQEFNREANTLCSKSQNTDLTCVGLDLKAVIDQMREQVQNVE